MLGDVGLVCDQEHGDAALRVQPLEDFHHLDARARVQIAGRLIRQDDGRFVDERPCDRRTLLLTAGRLVAGSGRHGRQGRQSEERARASVPLHRLEALPPCIERQLDVVERARARQEVEALEDEADLLVADTSQIVRDGRDASAPSRMY